MSQNSQLIEIEVKRGFWLYDGVLRKTVMIFRINYDVYYEIEKDEGLDMSDDTPDLNEQGESYLIRWPRQDFAENSGSFTVGGLTLNSAIEIVERTVSQKIDWITSPILLS
ncbi:hypothetical protein [Hymenobacter sp. PAMC 26628]|uniref:hypothetical protein n=1 Tax=Hymenobacter sp. PAMC 26628 TaxID=1484118 RepID=UPI000A610642|nr:hypothetical protein [Hymenobacter sp. PAMC 26628]